MEFLDNVYFDNTLKAYLVVGGIIFLVFLFKRYLSRYLASLTYRIANKIFKNVDRKNYIDFVSDPIEWFMVITIAVFSIDKLNFPAAMHFKIYGHTSQDIIERIGPGIMIAAFTWLLLRLIDFIAIVLEQRANQTPDVRDNQLIVFFRDFLKVIIGIVGVLWVVKASFYQPIGNVLTGLSLVGAGIALAAKESLENLIASFIIFFDKPFFTGDLVKVNAVTGVVERIGLRSTRVRTGEKTLITIPNKQMVDSMVDNWSMRTGRRAEIKLDLHPQTNAAIIETFIEHAGQLLESKKSVIDSYNVSLKDISKNGILVVVEYFTSSLSLTEFNTLKQDLLLSLKKQMEQDEIGMMVGNVGV